MKVVSYIKDRLGERSTYMFIIASLGTISSCPAPFNYIGGTLLGIASLVPDKNKDNDS